MKITLKILSTQLSAASCPFTDIIFAGDMVRKFKAEGKYAFVREQLSWIGLEHTFSEDNSIENVIPNNEKDELEKYLNEIYSKGKKGYMLEKDDRGELIEKLNFRDSKHKNQLLTTITALNHRLEKRGSNFSIEQFGTSRIVDGEPKKGG